MCYLKKALLILLGCLFMMTVVAEDSDPNDPLSKPEVLCTPPSGPSFCGPTPNSPTPNDGSCFERVASVGCKIIMGSGSSFCQWPFILRTLHSSMSEDNLCSNQKRWCQSHGYTDCGKTADNCKLYNKTFREQCLHL